MNNRASMWAALTLGMIISPTAIVAVAQAPNHSASPAVVAQNQYLKARNRDLQKQVRILQLQVIQIRQSRDKTRAEWILAVREAQNWEKLARARQAQTTTLQAIAK